MAKFRFYYSQKYAVDIEADDFEEARLIFNEEGEIGGNEEYLYSDIDKVEPLLNEED